MQKLTRNIQAETTQPDVIKTCKQPNIEAAKAYIKAGFALIPLLGHSKKPDGKGWNKKAHAITSIKQLEGLNLQNIGLAHAYSGTCCIDIDDTIKSVDYMNDNGIDLFSLLMADNAVQILSGRDNRAKLLYSTTETFSTFNHSENNHMIIEFRCATSNGLTVQDVLPPSIHPDTGKPYKWRGNWRKLPLIPPDLLAFCQKKTAVQDKELPLKDNNPHRRNMYSKGNAMYSMGITSKPDVLEHITSTQQVRNLFCTESIQKHLLDYLGFNDYSSLFKNGRVSVKSVIPPDNHNSGGLLLSPQGEVLFRDFSGACGHQHVTLPVLFARIVAGYFVPLIPTEKDDKAYGKVTLAVWAVRLLIESGIVKPPQVLLPPCPPLRNSVQQFYDGVKKLFQVRWAFKNHYGNPVTMGRKFMSAWCGLSEDQCRTAIKDLLKAGVILTVGQHGRARTYAPGYQSLQKPKGRTEQ